MKHYVVVLEWASEGENGSNVLDVKHSLEEARQVFNETLEEERYIAENNGWEIYEDKDDTFDAGEDGGYTFNHSRLYIQGVM